jgi:hypothetical protein
MPILQVNFKLNVSPTEYQEMCKSLAPAFAEVSGLQWKIWLLNEQEEEAGGIYLFNSEQALNDYLSGPIATQVKNHPALKDITMKRFDVMDEVTAVTRGPISIAAAAR